MCCVPISPSMIAQREIIYYYRLIRNIRLGNFRRESFSDVTNAVLSSDADRTSRRSSSRNKPCAECFYNWDPK